MSFNVGINVVEVDGKATPSIQPAPTSVTGFVIKATRGLSGQVVRVTSYSQFVERFGGCHKNAYGAYAVRGFFENGGATAMVTRVVPPSESEPSAASVRSGSGPFQLDHGDRLVIGSDIDGAVTATFSHVPAVLQGAAGPFVLATGGDVGGPEIGFTVNGVAADNYTFVEDDFEAGLSQATAEEVAAVLNREFVGVQAWVDDTDKLQIRTDRGDTHAALLAVGDAAEAFGLPVGKVSGGGNVADINAVTAEEAALVISNAAEPSGLLVSLADSRVVITHPNKGSEHWLQVVGDDGVPDAIGFNLDKHWGKGADDPSAPAAATHSFGTALIVAAGYRGQTDVGSWGNELGVEVAVNEQNEEDTELPPRFDLIVRYQGRTVETWTGLSMDAADGAFVESRINCDIAGSKYIVASASGSEIPPTTTATPLRGGKDGEFAPPSDDSNEEVNAYVAAIDLFSLFDIQLMCCPESSEPTVVVAGITHCVNKGDRMFVGHTPRDVEAGDINKTYVKELPRDRYGAIYFPWIQVADPLGSRKWIPPTGHVLGTYARTERERGIWKAPAGNAARLRGALDIRHHLTDADHTHLVKVAGVNAVRFISGQGILIDSSRTLSTNSLWLFVNVRLLFNFIKSSLKTGLRWVVQEPNDATLWKKVEYNSVRPFLMGLWRRGAFGSGSPDETFTIKIDAENNPPSNQQQGILNLEVYFCPSRPAETIVITIGQQDGGASASES